MRGLGIWIWDVTSRVDGRSRDEESGCVGSADDTDGNGGDTARQIVD